MFIGIDGCPAGWFVVGFDAEGFQDAFYRETFSECWESISSIAERVLIDVPIGLRENSNAPRPCDTAARAKLSPVRHNSVFPPPVREAVQQDSYADAKAVQEKRTTGSLGAQSWGIAKKINEVDIFLRKEVPEAISVIDEAHPEVCFWALNEEIPMQYAKTTQPAAAYWERIDVLETLETEIIEDIRDASKGVDAEVDNDDVLDAFVLALTASPLTGELQYLPNKKSDSTREDPSGKLPMEMAYAFSK